MGDESNAAKPEVYRNTIVSVNRMTIYHPSLEKTSLLRTGRMLLGLLIQHKENQIG